MEFRLLVKTYKPPSPRRKATARTTPTAMPIVVPVEIPLPESGTGDDEDEAVVAEGED